MPSYSVVARVSVIIPNYNHAGFLRERINSVLNQTFQDFELIILDDCSTDNSRSIIESYRVDPRISHIIYNPVNGGSTFKQWEKGLSLAKAKLVWIAESDDVMEPSFLAKAVAAFEEHESIGIFQCGSEWIDASGDSLLNQVTTGEHRIVSGKEFILNRMVFGNEIYNASAVVFKKELVQCPLPLAITRLSYCGDWLFWVQLLRQSNLFLLDENLNSFRRHEQNVSGKAEVAGLFYLEGIQVYAHIKKYFPEQFNFIDIRDKTWAYRFMKSNFPLSKVIRFCMIGANVSLLIPVYVMWFKWKKLWAKVSLK